MSGRPVSLIPGQQQIRGEIERFPAGPSPNSIEKPFPCTLEMYRLGLRHAYLWVLNGGEPPNHYGTSRCRECGCTDADRKNCIKRTGKACSWTEIDLCSACAEVKS